MGKWTGHRKMVAALVRTSCLGEEKEGEEGEEMEDHGQARPGQNRIFLSLWLKCEQRLGREKEPKEEKEKEKRQKGSFLSSSLQTIGLM